ncbi:hypothetical protein KC331_g6259 [Hortaea werneckii]|uniref:Uncharacterized protein n=1 Tax=Hortaea werneckii TaxID=91943 RepID=A0A3M7AUR8_HORWE|nr:hypothetical protein KC331_g6259 [Hortaea werneckii]RMY31253.1 hypothetical protein D0865_15048 [Hortaea werneckii]
MATDHDDPRDDGEAGSPIAPVHIVPQASIVSIEHPCIINNFDNALNSLGGEAQLKHVLDHRVGDSQIKVNGKTHTLPEPVAGVSLRPNDPLAKKLASTGNQTRNLLLKVTVPKWTGRKRKRGSSEPFMPATPSETVPSTHSKAPDLLRRLQDNENDYSFDPIGVIEETHRFRSQPDFQLHSASLPVTQQVHDHLTQPKYSALEKLRLDLRAGAKDANAFPLPPTLLQQDQPYRYEYQQAPYVVFTKDEHGNATTGNLQSGSHAKRQTSAIMADAPSVPDGPPLHLDSSSLPDAVKRVIPKIRELLDKRPLITRRMAQSVMPGLQPGDFFVAGQFSGYMFAAGPFRDILIKYGLDPRQDPEYRFYQSIMLYLRGKRGVVKTTNPQLSTTAQSGDPTVPEYIFDGTHADASGGSLWQMCDLTDPTLYGILHSPNAVRSTCDVYQWGWFNNGTMSKVRIIMRDKLSCLLAGETPPEEVYKQLEDVPDVLTEENVEQVHSERGKGHDNRKLTELRKGIRSFAKGYLHTQTRKGKGKGGQVEALREDGTLEQDGEVNEEVTGEGAEEAAEGVVEDVESPTDME